MPESKAPSDVCGCVYIFLEVKGSSNVVRLNINRKPKRKPNLMELVKVKNYCTAFFMNTEEHNKKV